jgi:succinate dehydrogenase/fumarate reductase flavoprotein subunit
MEENGQHMSTVLAKQVARHDSVRVLKDFFVYGLLKNGPSVVGVVGLDMLGGQLVAVQAKTTIIASGGYTSLWGFSDNPPTLTGDTIAMAYRAGADVVDLEFNQYYGTDVIWPPSVKGAVVLYELMISEFADGEITDKDGTPIIEKPLPIRDDAIKTIFQTISSGKGTEHGGVYFDTTKSPKGEEKVREVFQTMTPKHYQFLIDAAGIDLAKVPLEVAPASHYQCGGIFINERGQTSVDGLYACGECGGNFQGANRLAGSALCDTQTMGAQAGRCAAEDAQKRDLTPMDESDLQRHVDLVCRVLEKKSRPIRPVVIKESIRSAMDKHVAPFRDQKGLEEGLSVIGGLADEIPRLAAPDHQRYNVDLADAIEATLMLDTAELTLRAAMFREESRGHHNRTDFPETDDQNWRCHTVISQNGDAPKVSKRDVIYTRLRPEEL